MAVGRGWPALAITVWPQNAAQRRKIALDKILDIEETPWNRVTDFDGRRRADRASISLVEGS
jgi:hypothetical protein